jgi:hypothetical protein
MISRAKRDQIEKKLATPEGRKELAYLMVPAIRARLEGGSVYRQALFMKKTNRDFSRLITWKLMKEHFNIDKSKVRRKYENMGWKGWWE